MKRLGRLIAIAACWPLVAAAPVSGVAGPAPREIAYGRDDLQRLDFYPPRQRGAVPLVVYIHGGGWKRGDKKMAAGSKANFFVGEGYAFASLNYRLTPDVTVDEQAADVARAIAHLRGNARALGFAPDRIALIGHSAGAHLAALVATDPTYLGDAGVPMTSIRAVSLLDGAGYDVPRQVAEAPRLLRRIYLEAFGQDPDIQRRLSPITHADAPNALAFVFHCVATRADACSQADSLAGALRAAGSDAAVVPVSGKTHRTLNQDIGTPDDRTTADLASFFKRQL